MGNDKKKQEKLAKKAAAPIPEPFASPSSKPTKRDRRLASAIRVHNDAVSGGQEAVAKAEAVWGQLRLRFPDDAAAKAYYGSVLTLKARDAETPADKLTIARKGLGLLDEAVAAEPGNRTFRLIRGRICYRLPEPFFQRAETAVEDYALLIDEEIRRPGSLEKKEFATLVYELGEAYYRTERLPEAQVCLKKLETLTTDSKLLTLARTRQRVIAFKLDRARNGPSDSSQATPFELRDWVSVVLGAVGAAALSFAHRQ
ncbi:hypothetical protein [Cohnella sp. GCM10027633]|uniref:hypothetical protein n=1 Tax=unclassified Cohnella TaxID=2636738 RepID=UPI00362977FE